MTGQQPPAEPPEISPRDVFDRCNMPSRWERITNVAPKIGEDRRCLALLAARYLDEQRLPDPDMLVPPHEVQVREWAGLAAVWAFMVAAFLLIAGLGSGEAALLVAAAVLLAVVLPAVAVVRRRTAAVADDFEALQSRCVEAQFRLHANPLHAQYRSVLDQMINCDEGTLAYCAAKVVSEIRRDAAWKSERLPIARVDLFEELAEIACSARQIADERKATERLERNRLRDDPEVREMIAEDKQRRREAIGLLATRVHALADYRDRVVRLGMAAVREDNTANRAIRMAADEVAIDRLR